MNSLSRFSALDTRRWSPLTELRREMDQLFEDILSGSGGIPADAEPGLQWRPLCDVEETNDHFLISVEMPGVPRDGIQVEFRDNQVVVSGDRRHESRQDSDARRYSERRFGRFQRVFALPPGIDADKMEANYHDGILSIYVPKAESSKTRQIRITQDAGSGFLGKLLGSSAKAPERAREARAERVA